MNIIWDILIVAILAVCTVLAYRKGLIATLFGLLGVVIALVGAWSFHQPVGAMLDQQFVHEPVRQTVLNTLSDTPVLNYDDALANMDVAGKIRQMPDALVSLLKTVGISSDDILRQVGNATASSVEMKNQLIDRIADPISATISTAIAFVLLFVVLLLLCSVAAKLLGALCNLLPVGKRLNRIGGGVIGFIKGALIVLVITATLWAISAGIDSGFFARETLEKTLLVREIVNINPVANIFG